ncbi:hypothetical protein BDV93DRAFT_143620 [Ceratobasidium sp. AG-I]|nr:hypothetical protein BDV93DRAFT_143620 [Ceratobasidium sp. AG-I]
MKIEIVMDPSKAPAPSLASRVAPAPAAKPQAPKPAASGATNERSGKPAGAGRRGRGRRPKGGDRPAKTAADLDAEMEDYKEHKATPEESAEPAA